MDTNYDLQAEGLATSLVTLQAKFKDLDSDHTSMQVNAQGNQSTKTATAMGYLMDLTQLLDGEFNPSSPPSMMATTVTDLGSSWQTAAKAAEHCLDLENSYSVLITQYHDTDLGGWQESANKLDTALNAELEGTRNALHTQQETLQSANNLQAVSRESLETLRRKLDDQKHQYDAADKWTWLYPPARLALEAIKRIIEALTSGVADAERAVKTAEQMAAAAEQGVRDASQRLDNLNNTSQHQAVLLQQGKRLMSDCSSLLAESESTQTETARIKTQRYDAWQIVALCVNRAENAQYSLTKSDYGTTILQVAEMALKDETLKPQVAGIVNHLAQHDDNKGSIKNIRTDDHPEGLLSYVQKELDKIPVLQAPLLGFNLVQLAADTTASLNAEDRQKFANLIGGMRVF